MQAELIAMATASVFVNGCFIYVYLMVAAGRRW